MLTIENASVEDASALREIYDYYVKNTAISFEYETPTVEEFRRRMEQTMEFYPYLIARQDGEIRGYAYAGRFYARAAYDWCCETTIYLHRDAKKCGMGRTLYEALEETLGKMGVLNLYAIVAFPEKNDRYLTDNSLRFHEHLGFDRVGVYHRSGYKFDRWYHVACMEKIIGAHGTEQRKVIPYRKIK